MSRPEWVRASIADCVTSINSGVSVNSDDRPRGWGEVGVLKTSAVSAGSFKAEENKVVAKRDRSRVAESVLGGSVLFSRMNTPQLVGESCYVGADDPSLFLPDRLWQIRVDPARIDARWFSYALLEPRVASEIKGLATGTSGSMKNIAKASFLGVRLLIPPIEEQRWIVDVLDILDARISLIERVVQKLEKSREGLIRLSLGKRDFDQVLPLGSLAEISAGVTLGSEPSGPGTVDRPYLRVANVQDGHLDLRDVKSVRVRRSDLSRFELRPGDVLMNEGGDADKLGRGAVWEGQIPGCLHQNHVFRVRCQLNELNPQYLSLVSGSAIGKRYFLSASKQTTNLATINSQQIRQFPVPLRSLSLQLQIVEGAAAFTKKIESERSELAKVRLLKSGLMTDLLTGRVRVPEGTAS